LERSTLDVEWRPGDENLESRKECGYAVILTVWKLKVAIITPTLKECW
jgi:hypothetical protein